MEINKLVEVTVQNILNASEDQVFEAYDNTDSTPDPEVILDALLEAQEEVKSVYQELLGEYHSVHGEVEMRLNLSHIAAPWGE